MFSTTFAAVTLSAVLSTAAIATPTWQADYATAVSAATTQRKPVAVFIGRGDAGYAKVVGGEFPADARQLLAKNFVCVYIDTDTTAGQSLAGQFHLSKGLVISSAGGNVQALRHNGAVAPTELATYLTKYSDAGTVVTTEKAGEGAVVPASYSAPATYGSPAAYSAPATYGVPAGYAAPMMYRGPSSCPNGRCPNAR